MLDYATKGLVVNDPSTVSFVHHMIYDEAGDFGPSASLGWLDHDGVLEAGVVLHDFHPRFRRIELSAASVSKTWLSVERLNLIADYVFGQLNCYTLITRYDPSNRTARRLWNRIGGKDFILANLRGPGMDECMHILTVDEANQSKFWR